MLPHVADKAEPSHSGLLSTLGSRRSLDLAWPVLTANRWLVRAGPLHRGGLILYCRLCQDQWTVHWWYGTLGCLLGGRQEPHLVCYVHFSHTPQRLHSALVNRDSAEIHSLIVTAAVLAVASGATTALTTWLTKVLGLSWYSRLVAALHRLYFTPKMVFAANHMAPSLDNIDQR